MHWLVWLAAGSAWIGVVVFALVFSLIAADDAASREVIDDPRTFEVAVAMLSALIFSIPGIAFITIGFRRRSTPRGEPAPTDSDTR
jgi:hypothetical protein